MHLCSPIAAGLDVPPANKRLAADGDGDGILTSFDASLIARKVVGLPNTGIVAVEIRAGEWALVSVLSGDHEPEFQRRSWWATSGVLDDFAYGRCER